ncbi:MAG: (deoxy)nucleoside triphosphate pyrophosphohydrolase [Clostridia bacterium]|nr:(deoxy)nucleoside triphosphate pyrophosphohydrolase [Clostridia bacterium]MBQ8772227.1 (deoxy)nucleoside triphosphate pyrophosphohydrolase [Clostridia bacterium]
MKKTVEVVAALIWNNGKFLCGKRPQNKARAGMWEFPGGKVEAGETKQAALARECYEELGFVVRAQDEYCSVEHEYDDIIVQLTLFNTVVDRVDWVVSEYDDIAWVCPDEADDYQFCPADIPILEKLKKDFA